MVGLWGNSSGTWLLFVFATRQTRGVCEEASDRHLQERIVAQEAGIESEERTAPMPLSPSFARI